MTKTLIKVLHKQIRWDTVQHLVGVALIASLRSSASYFRLTN